MQLSGPSAKGSDDETCRSQPAKTPKLHLETTASEDEHVKEVESDLGYELKVTEKSLILWQRRQFVAGVAAAAAGGPKAKPMRANASVSDSVKIINQGRETESRSDMASGSEYQSSQHQGYNQGSQAQFQGSQFQGYTQGYETESHSDMATGSHFQGSQYQGYTQGYEGSQYQGYNQGYENESHSDMATGSQYQGSQYQGYNNQGYENQSHSDMVQYQGCNQGSQWNQWNWSQPAVATVPTPPPRPPPPALLHPPGWAWSPI